MNLKTELLNIQELKIDMVITKDVMKNGNLLIKRIARSLARYNS